MNVDTPMPAHRNPRTGFADIVLGATAALGLGLAAWALAGGSSGSAVAGAASAGWAVLMLGGRPAALRAAGALALLGAAASLLVSAPGPDDPVLAVLATTLLAGAIGAWALSRAPAPAVAAQWLVGCGVACGYLALAGLLPMASRGLDRWASVAVLLPVGACWALLHRADWRSGAPASALLGATGLGILAAATAGAAAGAPFLVGIAPGQVTMSPESALAGVGMLGALIALAYDRRQLALLLLAAPVAITLHALASRMSATVPAPVDAGWIATWLSARMGTGPAIAMLSAAIALGLGAMLDRRRGGATVLWLGGLVMAVLAAASLIATVEGFEIERIFNLRGGAVAPVSAMLALGIGMLLSHGAPADDDVRGRTVWLPLAATGVVVAASVLVSAAQVDAERRLADRARDQARQAVERALETSMVSRVLAVERFGQRLLSISAGERARLFDVETRQAFAGAPELHSVAWVDGRRRIRQVVSRIASVPQPGTPAADDARRQDAYARAERTRATATIGPLPLITSRLPALLMVTPIEVAPGQVEFLTAAIHFEQWLRTTLDAVAKEYDFELSSREQPDLRLARGERDWSARPAAPLRIADGVWELKLARAGGTRDDDHLPAIVAWTGLLIALLVGATLRLALVGRLRAAAAERARAALDAEMKARERSERLASRLLHGMSDGVLLLDADLRLAYANPPAQALLSSLRPDPIGTRLQDLFPRFAGSVFEAAFARARTEGRPVAVDAHAVALGRTLAGWIYPQEDGLAAILADVTELRRAERFETARRDVLLAIAAGAQIDHCIAKAIDLFEQRFDGATCGVLRLAPGTLRVAAAIARGIPAEACAAWIGREMTPTTACCGPALAGRRRVVTPDLAADPCWDGLRDGALAMGLRACWSQPVFDAAGTPIGSFAVYYREARGPRPDEEAALESIGALVGIAIERDLAAIRVETERQRFRSLSERSPYMVYAFDLERRLVDCNENVVRGGGFPRERLLGMDAEALVLKPYRDTVRLGFDAALRGESRRLACAVMTAAGVRREVEATLVPIEVDGRITGVFGVVRDITDERRIAAELDRALRDLTTRNRELQDFAYVASHDLQEPLRKVQAFSDRVLQRYAHGLDPQAVDYLRRIDGAAHRMQVLIDDLLAYSRVTSRGQPFAPVALREVLDDVLSDLEVRIEDSGARIECGALPVVDGDRTQLRQLLQNLLANALKFRAPGRAPVVRVGAAPGHDAGTMVLSVEDNGIGFDPAYAERIFAPFQRLHGRHEYDGTGIGLAVVRRIVERHHGTVVAVGRPGEGARFEVVLPSPPAYRFVATTADETTTKPAV